MRKKILSVLCVLILAGFFAACASSGSAVISHNGAKEGTDAVLVIEPGASVLNFDGTVVSGWSGEFRSMGNRPTKVIVPQGQHRFVVAGVTLGNILTQKEFDILLEAGKNYSVVSSQNGKEVSVTAQ